jgi:hypothetical protein
VLNLCSPQTQLLFVRFMSAVSAVSAVKILASDTVLLSVGGILATELDLEFYVLLMVHLGIIFVNNQLDAQFFFMYVYFYYLHVSGSHVPIIKRINCINATSGIYHSV